MSALALQSHWPKWGTRNPPPRWPPIITPPVELSLTLSNKNGPKQSTCVFTGSAIAYAKDNFKSTGAKAPETVPTTSQKSSRVPPPSHPFHLPVLPYKPYAQLLRMSLRPHASFAWTLNLCAHFSLHLPGPWWGCDVLPGEPGGSLQRRYRLPHLACIQGHSNHLLNIIYVAHRLNDIHFNSRYWGTW